MTIWSVLKLLKIAELAHLKKSFCRLFQEENQAGRLILPKEIQFEHSLFRDPGTVKQLPERFRCITLKE